MFLTDSWSITTLADGESGSAFGKKHCYTKLKIMIRSIISEIIRSFYLDVDDRHNYFRYVGGNWFRCGYRHCCWWNFPSTGAFIFTKVRTSQ